jgi:hypothetical protein
VAIRCQLRVRIDRHRHAHASTAVTAVLSTAHIVELARLRDFSLSIIFVIDPTQVRHSFGIVETTL